MFNNIKANLIYTYFNERNNFKIYPYKMLNDSLLNNYNAYYDKYWEVLTQNTNIKVEL